MTASGEIKPRNYVNIGADADFHAEVIDWLPAAKIEQGQYVPARPAPSKIDEANRAVKVALTVNGSRQEFWLAE